MDKKAVYILDFSPQFPEQQFYKISLNKQYDTMKIDRLIKALKEFPDSADRFLEIRPVIGREANLIAGRSMQLKIHNLNTFRYNVAVDDSLITYISEPPYLFSQLFLGDSGGLMGSLLTALEEKDLLLSRTKDLDVKIDPVQRNLLDQLGKSIEAYYKDYIVLQARVLSSVERTPCFPLEPEPKGLYIDMATRLLDIWKMFAELSVIKSQVNSEIADNNAEIAFITRSNNASEDTLRLLRDQEAQVEKRNQFLTLLSSLDSLQKTLPSEPEIRKLIQYVNSMTPQSQVVIKSIPVVSASELKLEISIEAKDSVMKVDPSAASEKYEISLSLPVIKYGYMSFSSGTFIGLGSELKSDRYVWEKQPFPDEGTGDAEEVEYELVPKGTNPLPAGFTALANYIYRAGPKFGLGASAGVGLTIEEKPRMAYMGGLSFAFGSKRQFLLSGGALYTPVRRLNGNLPEGYISNEPGPIEYYNDYKLAWFASLTFTPFKLK